jgi:TM2 domain-containing membrane protein YozV/rubrerythrin
MTLPPIPFYRYSFQVNGTVPSDETPTDSEEPNDATVDDEATDTDEVDEPTDADAETDGESVPKIGADPARDAFSSVEGARADESDAERSDAPPDDSATADTDEASEPDGDPTTADATGEMIFCRECGERIAASAPTCPDCGAPQDTSGGSSSEKDPGIAALASLIIPGAGQLYNGQFVRGAVAFVGVGVADVVLVLVALVLSLILIGPLFLLLIPAVHILVAYDAYDQAQKINSGEVTPGSGF